MTRILIIEDNRNLAMGLRNNLEIEGYQVELAADGNAGLERARAGSPDVIILDLMLPGLDGYRVLRALRADGSETPVLILSARGEETDKVLGFRLGADDYVTKPFGIDELLARVRAALRRSGGDAEVASFDAGEFRVDLEGRRVNAHGQEVRLTPKEFDLFVYMARHPNRVITHRTLLEAVWGEASQEQPEYLRVFMGQLRKKLEPDPSNPRYLVTEPWVGYRFNPNG